jgi:hypothetical protein
MLLVVGSLGYMELMLSYIERVAGLYGSGGELYGTGAHGGLYGTWYWVIRNVVLGYMELVKVYMKLFEGYMELVVGYIKLVLYFMKIVLGSLELNGIWS